MRTHRPVVSSDQCRGFSVLELLLAVSIMTVIIIGLYTVFDQTQKALRGTMAQVDVLEGIRATTDLVSRDLEGAAYLPMARYTNLYVARSPFTTSIQLNGLGQNEILTTVMQDLFFHTRVGERWAAVGFWVGPLGTNLPPPIAVGRLYRFSTNITPAQIRGLAGRHPVTEASQRNAFLSTFNSAQRILHSAPVLDGVVHFRLIAYDALGQPLFPNPLGTNYLLLIEDQLSQLETGNFVPIETHLAATLEPAPAESVQYLFSDLSYPTHPSALEIEIGVIEPQVLRQYESIAEVQPAEAAKFLSRHAGQIHLFRQRIPLRNSPQYQ
jgi:hypothetical protein